MRGKTPIAPTYHECTKAGTSIGGAGSIHQNYRTVMGVARYIRHPTEPSIPWILSVPSGRESTGVLTSRTARQTLRRKQRQIKPQKLDRTSIRSEGQPEPEPTNPKTRTLGKPSGFLLAQYRVFQDPPAAANAPARTHSDSPPARPQLQCARQRSQECLNRRDHMQASPAPYAQTLTLSLQRQREATTTTGSIQWPSYGLRRAR